MREGGSPAMTEGQKTADREEPGRTPPERFDHLLYRLLDQQDRAGGVFRGVFVGEKHDQPAIRQSLTHLLPGLRAHGLQTLSVELEQPIVDGMLRATTVDDYIRQQSAHGLAAFVGGEAGARELAALVQKARQCGLKVIGHEVTADRRKQRVALLEELALKWPEMGRIMQDAWEQLRDRPEAGPSPAVMKRLKAELSGLDVTKAGDDRLELLAKLRSEERHSLTLEGMAERDRLAADHIRRHASGKTLVLGGLFHSGNYDAADGWLTIAGMSIPGGLQIPNPRGVQSPNGYQGLDHQLGIPSVDYNDIDPAGRIGETTPTGGKYNNYEVILPKDLRQLHTTQWPPAGGVPTHEQLAAPGSLAPPADTPLDGSPPGLPAPTGLPPHGPAGPKPLGGRGR